jgi:hypothetical protein
MECPVQRQEVLSPDQPFSILHFYSIQKPALMRIIEQGQHVVKIAFWNKARALGLILSAQSVVYPEPPAWYASKLCVR